MGIVVQFPSRARHRFTAEMRSTLSRLAAATPAVQPLVFDEDDDGSELCRLGNGLTIGWERESRMVLTDRFSGYVDRGPFGSLDEICRLIACLAM